MNEISNKLNSIASRKTLVLLSGGSSAEIGVRALSNLNKNLMQNVTVMLADERYVDYNSPDCNGKLLKDLGVTKYCNEFIETIIPASMSIDSTVSLFRENILKYMDKTKSIIAVFGVGVDNHIAGILPKSQAATSKELIATSYFTEQFSRITISPVFFDKINIAYIYAEGKDKLGPVESVNENLNCISYPSQLVKKCDTWNILFNKEKL